VVGFGFDVLAGLVVAVGAAVATGASVTVGAGVDCASGVEATSAVAALDAEGADVAAGAMVVHAPTSATMTMIRAADRSTVRAAYSADQGENRHVKLEVVVVRGEDARRAFEDTP
jgi:hypothetical protein